MMVFSYEQFIEALENSGKDTYTAEDITKKVLTFFGFETQIIDNVLEKKDRDLFYMLEDEGILKIEKEEHILESGNKKGHIWRIAYWSLNEKKIESLLKTKICTKKDTEEKFDIYKNDELWEALENSVYS